MNSKKARVFICKSTSEHFCHGVTALSICVTLWILHSMVIELTKGLPMLNELS